MGDTCRAAAGPGRRRSVQIERLSAGTAHLGFPALLSVPHLLSREIKMNRRHYGADVWACSSKADEDKLEKTQNRAGRRILGLTWRFPSVVVRGEIGWRKLEFERHSMALQYLGRLRGMGAERWPRIVREALNEVRNTGTWADYVSALITEYNLRETWEHSKWGGGGGRFWKRQVVDQLEREGARAWREEVEQTQDLGSYEDKQLV